MSTTRASARRRCARSPRDSSRFTASTTSARCSMRPAIARWLTLMAVSSRSSRARVRRIGAMRAPRSELGARPRRRRRARARGRFRPPRQRGIVEARRRARRGGAARRAPAGDDAGREGRRRHPRRARQSLSGDSAILPMLVSISRRLQRRAAQAPELIEPSVKALDEAMEALETAAQSVEAALRACDFDPRELERCEERLFALRGMARKYGASVEALPALAEKYAGELADLSEGRARVARCEQAYAAAAADYAQAARALSARARNSGGRAWQRGQCRIAAAETRARAFRRRGRQRRAAGRRRRLRPRRIRRARPIPARGRGR